MNRRDLFKFLAFGAIAASGIAPQAVSAGWAQLMLSELVALTIKKHAREIAANVSRENALLRALMKAGKQTQSIYNGYELIEIPAPPGGVLIRG